MFIGSIVTFLITFTVWLPCLRNEFVDWDDLNMIVSNPRFNPPTWSATGWYWTHPAWNEYQPLTTTLWAGLAYLGWVDAPDQFGGHLNPAVFHLAGVLLHAFATVTLFTILNRLFRNQTAAAVGALMFALHPIQTEPVVFAGALNNPLAVFLSLLAIAQYLAISDRANTVPRTNIFRWILGSIALVLAMLAKPSAVVAPPIALLLDLAFFGRGFWPSLRSILPWALLILPCIIWTKLIQHGSDAALSPITLRPFLAGDAITFYLLKIAWPFHLAIDYGRSPQFVASSGRGRLALIAPTALIAISLLCMRRHPIVSASIAIFLVGLLPNSGLLPFDYQLVSTVADRYACFATIGMAVAGAALLTRFPRALPALALLLVFLITRVEMQITTWKNGETLFRHALEVNPNSWMSDINLATVIADRSPDEAVQLCQRAINLRPDRPDPWNTIGTIRLAHGDPSAAVIAFDRGHELAPTNPLFQANLDRARHADHRSKSP